MLQTCFEPTCYITPCLSTPAESTPESSPMKNWSVKLLPVKKRLHLRLQAFFISPAILHNIVI